MTLTPSRCTGHCCRLFPLQYGPEELEWMLDSQCLNASQVCDMVIYEGMFGVTPNIGEAFELPHYSCRYHNQETSDCDIYDYRPDVCRRHPHYDRGQACQHTECTYRSAENASFVQLVRSSVTLDQEEDKVHAD